MPTCVRSIYISKTKCLTVHNDFFHIMWLCFKPCSVLSEKKIVSVNQYRVFVLSNLRIFFTILYTVQRPIFESFKKIIIVNKTLHVRLNGLMLFYRKTSQKKRKTFDMTKARVKGTDAAAFVKSQAQLKVQESKVQPFSARWLCWHGEFVLPNLNNFLHCEIYFVFFFSAVKNTVAEGKWFLFWWRTVQRVCFSNCLVFLHKS